MSFVPITIDGQQYRLRYTGLAQIAIKKEKGKTVAELLNLAAQGDIELQVYLFWQGLMGGCPELRKMKFEEAAELRDKYLDSGELDDSSKYRSFLEALADASDAAAGADRKKAREKLEKDKERERIDAIKQALKEKKVALEELTEELKGLAEESSIGTQPPDSASESSVSP